MFPREWDGASSGNSEVLVNLQECAVLVKKAHPGRGFQLFASGRAHAGRLGPSSYQRHT